VDTVTPPFPVRTTVREDLIAAALSCWLFAGVYADFWAHKNLAPAASIATPWHAVLYTGLAATSAWILHLVDRRDGRSWRTGIPVGYASLVVGVALAFAAAAFDLTWHAVFGFEQGLDALLSPAHLLLFTGFTLVVMGPVRSTARRTRGRRHPATVLAPATIGLTLASSLWMLDVGYLSLFQNDLPRVAEEPVGVARALVTTTILTAAIVLVVRRWDPPFGLLTILTGGVVLAVGITDEFHTPRAIVAGLATGIALDLAAQLLRERLRLRGVRLAFAGIASLGFAATWLTVYAARSTQGWHVSSLAGSVTLCGLSGLALAALMQPREHDVA